MAAVNYKIDISDVCDVQGLLKNLSVAVELLGRWNAGEHEQNEAAELSLMLQTASFLNNFDPKAP